MAGMALSGPGTARCYDWYMDYLKVNRLAWRSGQRRRRGALGSPKAR
jgi:hypothetical protein